MSEREKTVAIVDANAVTALAHDQGIAIDEKVPVSVRVWEGMRRSLARLMLTCAQMKREGDEMLSRCRHAPGCPGEKSELEACLADCPDREWRLSALVIRANAGAHVGAFRLPRVGPDDILAPPSREFLDRMIAELELLRARDDWRTELARAKEEPKT